jgi:hypothetical protein
MVRAQLGYAADPRGNGVAYVRLTSRTGERLVRVAFRVQRFAGLDGREVGYAALTVVADLLRSHGVERVEFSVPDVHLVADVNEHRDVPVPIVLPYVRLGCSLNPLREFTIAHGEDRDLSQRALSEVALQPAA